MEGVDAIDSNRARLYTGIIANGAGECKIG